MKRLALIAAIVVVGLPAAASGAACSPLNCAPSQFLLGHGSLLGVRIGADRPVRVIDLRSGATRWRLPPGIVTRDVLVHQDGTLLTWYDAARGTRLRDATTQLHGSFLLVGASQDASRAVLARTQSRSTTFAIVSPAGHRIVKLGTNTWQFDALYRHHLFLIRYLHAGYQVRLFDLATNRLDPQPLKDPGEPALISGIPWSRLSSADGRYLFTLYLGNDGGQMIHQLDLRDGTARCIDLPGGGDFNASMGAGIVLSKDGRTLYAVTPGYGRVVVVDVASHSVRGGFRFDAGSWNGNPGMASLSPNGKRIALTDAYHLWFVDLAGHRVLQGATHVAIALGYSPDGRKLWGVGEKSRVVRLPLR